MIQGVILAAGRGSRLGFDGPKALAPLGGETLLGRQLRLFRARGVGPITVVGGWRGEELRVALPAGVDYVHNPDFEGGSVVSWRSVPLREGRVLLAHGDLAYDESVLDLALKGGTLADPHFRVKTREEVLIWSVRDEARGLGRGTPAGPCDRFGEFVGLSCLESDYAEAFQRFCRDRSASDDYEVPVLSDFLQGNPLPLRFLERAQFWMNVNYPDDLAEARARLA